MNIFAFTIREARCMRIKPDETDTDCVFSNDDDVSRKQIKDACSHGGGTLVKVELISGAALGSILTWRRRPWECQLSVFRLL
jgi:hypothetical protein